MKRIFILIVLLGLFCAIFASTEPALIITNIPKLDVNVLNKLNISIDNVTQNSIRVYVNEKDFQALLKIGFDINYIPNQAKIYAQQLEAETRNSNDPMNAYYSLDEYNTFLTQTAQQYPNICQLIQIGTSVQNRPIYFMKISDNATLEENEPEVRLTSSIHGDEVTGYDLLIRYIKLLTTEYTTNPRIANIVNNTEVWINPMTNPDGYALHQRENANDVDLNRTFPSFSTGDENDVTGSQPEIIAQKAFADSHTSNYSLNYHGGAQVVNYPWDQIYTLHPDNDVFVDLATTYAINNPTDLYNSTEFTHGITNGAAWYVILGSLQDWLNYYYTCMDVTVEISSDKWPNATALDGFWNRNKESLLKFTEKSQNGLHGLVYGENNTPLAAEIQIANRMTSYTDPQVGDFHRLLMPGTYSLVFKAFGYEDFTMNNVQIIDNQPTNVTANLIPKSQVSFTGYVKNNQNQPIANALVKITADSARVATTDANGFFELTQLYTGSYNISISAPDLMPFSQTITLGTSNLFNFVLAPPSFSDSFDNGLTNWEIQSPWGIQSISGNNVLSDSPLGDYASNANKSAKIMQSFNLNDAQSAVFVYDVKYDLETGYDFLYVEISTNNTSWTTLKSYTGTVSDFINENISLSQYVGQTISLRFRLQSDSGVNQDGVLIDNVKFSNQNHYTVANDNIETNKPFISCLNYPNPFSTTKGTVFSVISNQKNTNNTIEIFNIKGQKIRTLSTDKKGSVSWDSKNSNNKKVSNGIYFYRVVSKNIKSNLKKMTLVD